MPLATAQPALQSTSLPRPAQLTFVTKWVASIFQIFGYAATAFGLTPWNIGFFLIGLIGWFMVGVMWRDRAIMLIHIIALAAMVIGLASNQA